jgi:secondary thiamine-phosphate synthase enzyme
MLICRKDYWQAVGKLETTFFNLYCMEADMLAGILSVPTRRVMEFIDITDMVSDCISSSMVPEGICSLFNPHTTAGLTINEGADPAVQDDIIAGLQKIVPVSQTFKHLEGNSPAHIMASLMGCSLTVFFENNRLVLGTWQKIFLCEFDGPRKRTLRWRIT